jgi:hypothetical protein
MKVFKTAAIFLTLSASAAWAAADPQLLGLLMPEAKAIAGVQLSEAQASPFGQFVLSQVLPGTEFDKIKAETGFDPRTDLTQMVAGSSLDGGGLIAGRGTFQTTRIANLAMTAGAKVESYRGISIVGDGTSKGVAFLDASTVLIGDSALVKAAIDRWLSSTRTSTALSAKAAETSSTSQAWAVATGLSQFIKPTGQNVPPEAQMMQNVLSKIEQIAGGLNFGDTVTMRGQAVTTSAQDAQALRDVFQLVLTMASGKTPLPVVPQVSASGTTVTLTASLTEQQIEQFLKPAASARAAVRVARKPAGAVEKAAAR